MGQLLTRSRNNNNNNNNTINNLENNNGQLQTPSSSSSSSQGTSTPEHKSPVMGAYPLNDINSVASKESVSFFTRSLFLLLHKLTFSCFWDAIIKSVLELHSCNIFVIFITVAGIVAVVTNKNNNVSTSSTLYHGRAWVFIDNVFQTSGISRAHNFDNQDND
jgi:hypothetical protein